MAASGSSTRRARGSRHRGCASSRSDPTYVYHSEQGGAASWISNIGDRNIRFTPIVAIDNADDLVEEYSGYGLRFEARKLGTRRLGASLEWSRFDQDWRGATLDALALRPEIPPPYETRSTITPLVKFAFTPDLSVAAGVSISELEPLVPGNRLADGQRGRRLDRLRPALEGRFRCDAPRRRAASACAPAPASSKAISPTRGTSAQGSYRFDFGRHHVQATGMAGGITGDAPLFERFTLGDSTTLRGWDKYDIAPAGGDRVFYSSIEYRYTGLALFLDVGSVWDANTERKVRVSTGFGFHAGPAFLAVGFPLNTDDLTAVVHGGSADSRGWDPVVATGMAGSPSALLALLAWPAACGVGTDADRRHRRRRAEDPRARLQLPEGRSARSIEGRPIGARGARRDGAARAREVAGGDDAADLRLELRSLGGTIRRDRRWMRAPSPSRT